MCFEKQIGYITQNPATFTMLSVIKLLQVIWMGIKFNNLLCDFV